MFKDPITTSTPNNSIAHRPKGRASYKKKNNSVLSPIYHQMTPENSPLQSKRKCSPKRKKRTLASSENKLSPETSSDESCENTERTEEDEVQILRQNAQNTPCTKEDAETFFNIQNLLVLTVLIFAIYYIIPSFKNLPYNIKKISIDQIKENFPHQHDDTWIAIESGIKEVEKFNKPSVFLFIHDSKTKPIINDFLKNVSYFASSILLNYETKFEPIIVDVGKLQIIKLLDYGTLIEEYRNDMEKKRVMIVQNLDEFPGELAPVFHSLCDEYNPLVKKSVYLFTMKVNESEQNISNIERILRLKWSNLKDDLFDPLFTRISSMVISLVPEDQYLSSEI